MWDGNPSSNPPSAYDSGSLSPTNNPKITREQMNWLRNNLSTHEQMEVRAMASSCMNQVTLTRGLPAGIASLAGLLYLKNKFNWSPVSRVIIFGIIPPMTCLITTAITYRSHPCGAALHNHLSRLYAQHQSQQSAGHSPSGGGGVVVGGGGGGGVYAQRREANRAGRPFTAEQPPPAAIGGGVPSFRPESFSSMDSAHQQQQPYYISGTPMPPRKSGPVDAKYSDYGGTGGGSDGGFEMLSSPELDTGGGNAYPAGEDQQYGQRERKKTARGRGGGGEPSGGSGGGFSF